MLQNGALQDQRKSIGISLDRGLQPEIQQGSQQRLHIRSRHLRNATLKDKSDSRTGRNLAIVSHNRVCIVRACADGDMPEEAMFTVWSAIQIKDNPVACNLHVA